LRTLNQDNRAAYKLLKSNNKLAEKELKERCADSIDFADGNSSFNRARNSAVADEEKNTSYKQFKSAPVTAVKAKEEDASDSTAETALLVIIALLGLILLALTGLYCQQKRRKSSNDTLRFEAPIDQTPRDNVIDTVGSSARDSADGAT